MRDRLYRRVTVERLSTVDRSEAFVSAVVIELRPDRKLARLIPCAPLTDAEVRKLFGADR